MKHIIIEKRIVIDGDAHGNCKPVYGISNGKIYSSVKEAAKDMNVTTGAMSKHLIGRTKRVHHMKFCLVSDMPFHVMDIASEAAKLANIASEAQTKMEKVQALAKEIMN